MSARPEAERLHTLVVDDDPEARGALRELLELDPELELVGECGSGPEALRVLRQVHVDLLLLDVQLPGMDGFELLEAAGPGAVSAVVLVTAHEGYALRAFDAGALHYLLKPFDGGRLAAVLTRAKSHVRGLRIQEAARRLGELSGTLAPAPAPPAYLERLAVKEAGRVLLLPVEQVDWVEADDYYVQVHAGARAHLLRQSLRELEAQLDPRHFLRIHRSTLVNVARVKELQPLLHGEYWVLLHDGQRLKLSRSYRDRLGALLGGHPGPVPGR